MPQASPTRVAEGNIGGNHYDKYGSRNPLARRLMSGFLGAFDELVDRASPRSSYEIGCGEGKLSCRLLERGVDARGSDVEAEPVALANQASAALGFGARFAVASLYDLRPGEIETDLLICCEVLEHVTDPLAALDVLAAQRVGHILLSVPREPIWRVLNMARGSYLGALGNTPGHINHWSQAGFVQMVASKLDVIEVRSPLPWTMLLCRGRGR
jgi:2-polyprenyl-3-methyl-5-hydroxy-6-metoxy-1,4-benzoquinol methylase